MLCKCSTTELHHPCLGVGVLSRCLLKARPADTLSLPAGIAPSLLLAKGKVAGAPAQSRVPSPQLRADAHLHHTGHPPASPTSGGRRGGRWMMGWLRGVLRDPVSRQGPERVGMEPGTK